MVATNNGMESINATILLNDRFTDPCVVSGHSNM